MDTMTFNSNENISQPKLLGEILQEAGLISSQQLELALQDQSHYYHLKIGEIIALRGWLPQETIDFFAEQLPFLLSEEEYHHHVLGYYLKSANLLTEKQVKAILKEQKQLGVKFGSIAVLKGYLKQETIDYFVQQIEEHKKRIESKVTLKSNNRRKALNRQQIEESKKSHKDLIYSSLN